MASDLQVLTKCENEGLVSPNAETKKSQLLENAQVYCVHIGNLKRCPPKVLSQIRSSIEFVFGTVLERERKENELELVIDSMSFPYIQDILKEIVDNIKTRAGEAYTLYDIKTFESIDYPLDVPPPPFVSAKTVNNIQYPAICNANGLDLQIESNTSRLLPPDYLRHPLQKRMYIYRKLFRPSVEIGESVVHLPTNRKLVVARTFTIAIWDDERLYELIPSKPVVLPLLYFKKQQEALETLLPEDDSKNTRKTSEKYEIVLFQYPGKNHKEELRGGESFFWNAASRFGNAVSNTASRVGNFASNAVSIVGNTIGSTLRRGGQMIGDTARQSKDTVVNTVVNTVSNVRENVVQVAKTNAEIVGLKTKTEEQFGKEEKDDHITIDFGWGFYDFFPPFLMGVSRIVRTEEIEGSSGKDKTNWLICGDVQLKDRYLFGEYNGGAKYWKRSITITKEDNGRFTIQFKCKDQETKSFEQDPLTHILYEMDSNDPDIRKEPLGVFREAKNMLSSIQVKETVPSRFRQYNPENNQWEYCVTENVTETPLSTPKKQIRDFLLDEIKRVGHTSALEKKCADAQTQATCTFLNTAQRKQGLQPACEFVYGRCADRMPVLLESLRQYREALNNINQQLETYYAVIKQYLFLDPNSRLQPLNADNKEMEWTSNILETIAKDEMFAQELKAKKLSQKKFDVLKKQAWQTYFNFFSYLHDTVEREFLVRYNDLNEQYRGLTKEQSDFVKNAFANFSDNDFLAIEKAMFASLAEFRIEFRGLVKAFRPFGDGPVSVHVKDRLEHLIRSQKIRGVDAYSVIEASGLRDWDKIVLAVKSDIEPTHMVLKSATGEETQRNNLKPDEFDFVRSDIEEIQRYLNEVLLPKTMMNIMQEETNQVSLKGGARRRQSGSQKRKNKNKKNKVSEETEVSKENNGSEKKHTTDSEVLEKNKRSEKKPVNSRDSNKPVLGSEKPEEPNKRVLGSKESEESNERVLVTEYKVIRKPEVSNELDKYVNNNSSPPDTFKKLFRLIVKEEFRNLSITEEDAEDEEQQDEDSSSSSTEDSFSTEDAEDEEQQDEDSSSSSTEDSFSTEDAEDEEQKEDKEEEQKNNEAEEHNVQENKIKEEKKKKDTEESSVIPNIVKVMNVVSAAKATDGEGNEEDKSAGNLPRKKKKLSVKRQIRKRELLKEMKELLKFTVQLVTLTGLQTKANMLILESNLSNPETGFLVLSVEPPVDNTNTIEMLDRTYIINPTYDVQQIFGHLKKQMHSALYPTLPEPYKQKVKAIEDHKKEFIDKLKDSKHARQYFMLTGTLSDTSKELFRTTRRSKEVLRFLVQNLSNGVDNTYEKFRHMTDPGSAKDDNTKADSAKPDDSAEAKKEANTYLNVFDQPMDFISRKRNELFDQPFEKAFKEYYEQKITKDGEQLKQLYELFKATIEEESVKNKINEVVNNEKYMDNKAIQYLYTQLNTFQELNVFTQIQKIENTFKKLNNELKKSVLTFNERINIPNISSDEINLGGEIYTHIFNDNESVVFVDKKTRNTKIIQCKKTTQMCTLYEKFKCQFAHEWIEKPSWKNLQKVIKEFKPANTTYYGDREIKTISFEKKSKRKPLKQLIDELLAQLIEPTISNSNKNTTDEDFQNMFEIYKKLNNNKERKKTLNKAILEDLNKMKDLTNDFNIISNPFKTLTEDNDKLIATHLLKNQYLDIFYYGASMSFANTEIFPKSLRFEEVKIEEIKQDKQKNIHNFMELPITNDKFESYKTFIKNIKNNNIPNIYIFTKKEGGLKSSPDAFLNKLQKNEVDTFIKEIRQETYKGADIDFNKFSNEKIKQMFGYLELISNIKENKESFEALNNQLVFPEGITAEKFTFTGGNQATRKTPQRFTVPVDKGTTLAWDQANAATLISRLEGGKARVAFDPRKARLAMNHPRPPPPRPAVSIPCTVMWLPGKLLTDIERHPLPAGNHPPHVKAYRASCGLYGKVYFLAVSSTDRDDDLRAATRFETDLPQSDQLGLVRLSPQTVVLTHALLRAEDLPAFLRGLKDPGPTAPTAPPSAPGDPNLKPFHYIHVLPQEVHVSTSPFIGWHHPFVGGVAQRLDTLPDSHAVRNRSRLSKRTRRLQQFMKAWEALPDDAAQVIEALYQRSGLFDPAKDALLRSSIEQLMDIDDTWTMLFESRAPLVATHRLQASNLFATIDEAMAAKKKRQETFGSIVHAVLERAGHTIGTFAVMQKSEQQELLRNMAQKVLETIESRTGPLRASIQQVLSQHPSYKVLLSRPDPPPSLDALRAELQVRAPRPVAAKGPDAARPRRRRFVRFAQRPYHVEELLPDGSLALRVLKVLRYRPSPGADEVHEIRSAADDPLRVRIGLAGGHLEGPYRVMMVRANPTTLTLIHGPTANVVRVSLKQIVGFEAQSEPLVARPGIHFRTTPEGHWALRPGIGFVASMLPWDARTMVQDLQAPIGKQVDEGVQRAMADMYANGAGHQNYVWVGGSKPQKQKRTAPFASGPNAVALIGGNVHKNRRCLLTDVDRLRWFPAADVLPPSRLNRYDVLSAYTSTHMDVRDDVMGRLSRYYLDMWGCMAPKKFSNYVFDLQVVSDPSRWLFGHGLSPLPHRSLRSKAAKKKE